MAPFQQLVGLTSSEGDDSPATATMSVRVEKHHLNRNGTVHGGLVATLADSAMAAAVRSSAGEDRSGVTVAMTVSYLEPAQVGDELRATAEVRKDGKRILVVEADVVRDADGTAVAHAVATFTAVQG